MRNKINYTQNQLNRSNILRYRHGWIKKQLNDPKAQILPILNEKNLIRNINDNLSIVSFSMKDLVKISYQENDIFFLGFNEDIPFFCIDCSTIDPLLLDSIKPVLTEFANLKKIAPLLTRSDSSLLAHAKGISFWHQQNKYCGKCGNKTISKIGGNMRRCSKLSCQNELFPQVSPAVIMLIENTTIKGNSPHCLLGRHKDWPTGRYSTLAGFVEIGETIEEAVKREVLEEVGIITNNTVYVTSQPWPFPSSLMLGFNTNALTSEITLDKTELEDARWFSVDEILSNQWPDLQKRVTTDQCESLSDYLIWSWVQKVTTNKLLQTKKEI